ncbi:MAG: ribosomal protein [Clostridiales bacterium]|nr:ribosomal protein [Clostridiales bacterium]
MDNNLRRMNMENMLYANIRGHESKGENHRLRSSGKIPGVLYGMKNPVMLVEFGEMELGKVLNTTGEHGIVNVNLSGKCEVAIIKEVQRDPFTRKITHMDLQRINNTQIIKTKVPVVLRGEEYYKNSGTIVQQQVNQIEVECTPNHLPRHIYVDISQLSNKHRITVGDLEVGEEISILNNPLSTVVSLTYSKNNSKEEEAPNSIMAVHSDDIL